MNLGMDGGEELTEQETALYDRQIRVWGVDAQRRLSKSHILVSGLKGTVVEFCKNIVLAGVGSLTLNDDREVTEEVLAANFLIPADENAFDGRSIAELCCDSLKDFNPMVRVSVQKGLLFLFAIQFHVFEPIVTDLFCLDLILDDRDANCANIETLPDFIKILTGDLSSFGADFFDKFNVVVISSCSLATKRLVDESCRKLSKRVAFYTVDCRDSCGEIFVDLQNYTYSKKKLDETVECQLKYPSFEEAIAIPWRSLPKRVSKLYFAMRVVERFEEVERRKPGETSISDLSNVLKLRKELCLAHSLNESQIPDALLERLIAVTREFPPVCAVVGGILGQEVIKALSGKGDPLKNFFFYDAVDGKGVIEDISNS
ncbi:hypothetical protein RJ639_010203 [Escallonia herrerae]|uniref:THIF-type NAD/FAD binding fold domain-containing protein n=1 Tax=Escallonia herrerae TaxID=1293975 RepID=A0AA88VRW7_9ASTE|nr:hypothetical protein RJ639_010203 [Escallonia herrerae]